MNRTTLIIDGNWLMMSRLGVMMNKFSTELNENQLQSASNELVDFLAQSVNKIINFFGDSIDNIIMVQDGGSWRKHVRRPKLYQDEYKGNRVKDEALDWNYIWKSLDQFCQNFKNANISCFSEKDCEGDDWCWYWSNELNKKGINTIIWSSDRDLQQLVTWNKNGSWTAWYNDKAGLVCHKSLKSETGDLLTDMLSISNQSQSFEYLKMMLEQRFVDISYIDPLDIIMEKVICGDSGDNIKAIMRLKKGDRIARVSEKEWGMVKEGYGSFLDNLNKFKAIAKPIIKELKQLKRFQGNADSEDDLYQMFLFNMRLVCLDSKYIPKEIKDRMKSHKDEYVVADMESIINNYKVLAPSDDVPVDELFDIF